MSQPKISKRQRGVLIVYLVGFAFLCAWVPWQRAGSYKFPVGYSWLWKTPDPPYSRVDVTRIGLNLLILTALGGVAWLLVSRRGD